MPASRILAALGCCLLGACVVPRVQDPIDRPQEPRLESNRALLPDGAALPLASGFYSLLAVTVLLGFANGIGTGVVMIFGADLARASLQQGQFLGLWRLIGDLGTSLAPLLAGVLVGAAGLAAASAAVAGIGVAGSLVMTFLVAETLSSPG